MTTDKDAEITSNHLAKDTPEITVQTTAMSDDCDQCIYEEDGTIVTCVMGYNDNAFSDCCLENHYKWFCDNAERVFMGAEDLHIIELTYYDHLYDGFLLPNEFIKRLREDISGIANADSLVMGNFIYESFDDCEGEWKSTATLIISGVTKGDLQEFTRDMHVSRPAKPAPTLVWEVLRPKEQFAELAREAQINIISNIAKADIEYHELDGRWIMREFRPLDLLFLHNIRQINGQLEIISPAPSNGIPSNSADATVSD